MLNIADVFHVSSDVGGIGAAVTVALPCMILGVVIFAKEAELRSVHEALIHPAAGAPVVVTVTVEQLLD